MSLKDTINAARDEAKEGGSVLANAMNSKKKNTTTTTTSKQSNTKKKSKSAASAKPAREAASSVRTVESATKRANDLSLSKEERKAARKQERTDRDIRAQAYQIMLDNDEDYRKTDRIWWIILGVGFAFTLIALAIYYLSPRNSATSEQQIAAAGIVAIVMAYGCIIAAFIYDWVKRRPIRRALEAKADGLTDKRIQAIFEDERKRRAAKQAEKEARKAARSGK